jgi:hypothetical protein
LKIKKFLSPFNEKDDYEIVEIAHNNYSKGNKDLVVKARKELKKRYVIRLNNEHEIPKNWTKESREYFINELKRLDNNKKKKYSYFEFIIHVFIALPLSFYYLTFPPPEEYKSLLLLYKEKYYQMFFQRITALALGLIIQVLTVLYFINN